jgi:DNA-binding response OmpR family regulator
MSPRVLIVDDEPSIVHGLKYAFEREGFDVDVATDGLHAVAVALSEQLDLVVLDVMLPRLSGLDACKRIRAENTVPIIMLTARDSERDLLEGLEVGADDYMTKPFSAAELIGRAQALLRRRELDRGSSRTERSVGEITIDLVHDRVSVRGRKVTLTPSEYKILSLLAGEPGAVFSRRQIMERLWDSSHTGDEHACEVHVSSLRRKLATEPQPIITVRGRGYKLTAPTAATR